LHLPNGARTKKGEGSCYGPELFQVTEKLSPLVPDRDDGWALMAPELETIVITWTEEPKDPIAPVAVPTVAVHDEKETVPKSASGRMPPLEDGASAIHSAEDR